MVKGDCRAQLIRIVSNLTTSDGVVGLVADGDRAVEVLVLVLVLVVGSVSLGVVSLGSSTTAFNR